MIKLQGQTLESVFVTLNGEGFLHLSRKTKCKVKKWMDLVVSEGRIPQTMLTRGHQANNGEDIQETTLRPLEKDEASARRPGRGQEPSRDPSERGLSRAPAFLNRRRSMALKGAGWHGSSSRLWQKAAPGFPTQSRGVEVPSGGRAGGGQVWLVPGQLCGKRSGSRGALLYSPRCLSVLPRGLGNYPWPKIHCRVC